MQSLAMPQEEEAFTLVLCAVTKLLKKVESGNTCTFVLLGKNQKKTMHMIPTLNVRSLVQRFETWQCNQSTQYVRM